MEISVFFLVLVILVPTIQGAPTSFASIVSYTFQQVPGSNTTNSTSEKAVAVISTNFTVPSFTWSVAPFPASNQLKQRSASGISADDSSPSRNENITRMDPATSSPVVIGKTKDQRIICGLKPESGPCRAFIPAFYYDPSTASCLKFIYGGCSGNANRFATEKDCLNFCEKVNATVQRTTTPSNSPDGDCFMPTDPGQCSPDFDAMPQLRYSYNPASQRCESFSWLGCDGNVNNFATEEECEEYCNVKTTTMEWPTPSDQEKFAMRAMELDPRSMMALAPPCETPGEDFATTSSSTLSSPQMYFLEINGSCNIGAFIKNIQPATPDLCARECLALGHCVAFTFYSNRNLYPNFMCRLRPVYCDDYTEMDPAVHIWIRL